MTEPKDQPKTGILTAKKMECLYNMQRANSPFGSREWNCYCYWHWPTANTSYRAAGVMLSSHEGGGGGVEEPQNAQDDRGARAKAQRSREPSKPSPFPPTGEISAVRKRQKDRERTGMCDPWQGGFALRPR